MSETAPSRGPYFSSYGPAEGYVLADTAPVMGVLREPGGWPTGTAWLNGTIPSRHGPVQVWRLTIRPGGLKGPEVELEGRWVCRNREFIRLGDAAEEV